MDNNLKEQPNNENDKKHSDTRIVGPMTIMVVENDPDTRLLISMLLKNLGHAVIEAPNGQKAVELVQEVKPGMILMDVHMPVMDGFAATKRIREMDEPYRSIIIIGLVAGAVKDDCEKCRNAGMNDCIFKPFRLEEILGKLKVSPAA
ncbi:MAG TPA: response regulator [Agriterribacter sp.]|nr:response regulator [Chitinophagaceae bacterium]HRP32479.1 response regulator [Agriterribacter sp.]